MASACSYDLAPVRTSQIIVITIIVPCVRGTACVNGIQCSDDILSADPLTVHAIITGCT